MKRTIYNTLKITALLAAAFLTFSCAEKEPEVKETPVFPEMIEDNDIVPGSEITLSFVPNMDWTLRMVTLSSRPFQDQLQDFLSE